MNGLPTELVAKLTGQATAEQQQVVQAKIKECFDRLRPIFPQVTLTEPTVNYELKGNIAGRALGGARITLNIDLLNSKYYDDIINRTLPHEIAHIVTYQVWIKQGNYTRSCKPHGRQWAYVMNCLGLAATRCHNYETEPQRVHKRPHEYHCACSTHWLTNLLHNRITADTHHYNCTTCGGPITKTGGN